MIYEYNEYYSMIYEYYNLLILWILYSMNTMNILIHE